MREIKSLFILLSLLCFFSCEQEEKLSSANPIDYEFTVKLNGVTHKIQGNTSITVPIPGVGSNGCYSTNYTTSGHYVMLDLNDASATNYINGQTLTWNILFDNLLLGNSVASVSSVSYGANSYLSSFIDLIGGFNNGSSFQISSVQTLDYTPIPLTFNITDLGTPTVQNPNPTGTFSDMYIWGESLKGNFSGTVYAQSDSYSGPYDIPFLLEIDFEVIRYGY